MRGYGGNLEQVHPSSICDGRGTVRMWCFGHRCGVGRHCCWDFEAVSPKDRLRVKACTLSDGGRIQDWSLKCKIKRAFFIGSKMEVHDENLSWDRFQYIWVIFHNDFPLYVAGTVVTTWLACSCTSSMALTGRISPMRWRITRSSCEALYADPK